MFRAVTKISSYHIYAIRQGGIEQLGISPGSIFLLFPLKIVKDHAHSIGGNPKPLVRALIVGQRTCNVQAATLLIYFGSAEFEKVENMRKDKHKKEGLKDTDSLLLLHREKYLFIMSYKNVTMFLPTA